MSEGWNVWRGALSGYWFACAGWECDGCRDFPTWREAFDYAYAQATGRES